MSQELEAKRKHLESLEDFLASPAHKGYVSAVKQDIVDTRDMIVALEPKSLESFVDGILLRGELRCLETRLTMFEDARVTLKDRIERDGRTGTAKRDNN